MNALLRFLVLCQYNTGRAALLLPCECKPKDRKQGCHGLGMRLQSVPILQARAHKNGWLE